MKLGYKNKSLCNCLLFKLCLRRPNLPNNWELNKQTKLIKATSIELARCLQVQIKCKERGEEHTLGVAGPVFESSDGQRAVRCLSFSL